MDESVEQQVGGILEREVEDATAGALRTGYANSLSNPFRGELAQFFGRDDFAHRMNSS